MNKMSVAFMVFLIVNFLPSITVFGASFDCVKASNKTEKAICADPNLSALDDMMAIVWDRYVNKLNDTFPLADGSITEHPPLVPDQALEQQRNWLSETRACEGKFHCISDSYTARIQTISTSTFSATGASGKSAIRRYFQRSDNLCEPSNLSVDAFFDANLNLCYEIIPLMRYVEVFSASGVGLITYHELSPGYYDCAAVNLIVMETSSEDDAPTTWNRRYSYSEYNDVSDGLRHEYGLGDKINLAIKLNEGFEFDEYYVGCGMRNLDISGGSGFGGVD